MFLIICWWINLGSVPSYEVTVLPMICCIALWRNACIRCVLEYWKEYVVFDCLIKFNTYGCQWACVLTIPLYQHSDFTYLVSWWTTLCGDFTCCIQPPCDGMMNLELDWVQYRPISPYIHQYVHRIQEKLVNEKHYLSTGINVDLILNHKQFLQLMLKSTSNNLQQKF